MIPQVRFSPSDHPSGGPPGTPNPLGEFPSQGDDLPYRVEVWDSTGEFVEHVVAVTLSPAIGYAAYYAARREYPDRSITLRHKTQVISRWTTRTH